MNLKQLDQMKSFRSDTFKRHKIRFITVTEMNKHLSYVYKYYDVQYREKLEIENFGQKAFIEDLMVHFKLSYKKAGNACTYVCRKDGVKDLQEITGGEAFRILSKYYKVPRMDEKYCGKADFGGLSASPFCYFNPKYNNTRNYAYGYDINSAYAYAMLSDMPDTSKPMKIGKIIKGKEIGFIEELNPKTETTMLVPIWEGFSLYVFPLMKSPFKKFVDTWYNIKKNGTKKERNKAKNVLNFSVGYLQRVNPFLRATIIGICNNRIKSLINEETTLFCNTDSIVSLTPLDLKISDECGDWKLENKGIVAYKDYSYQWQNGKLSYKGIPKSWFKKDWDILKDDLPTMGNIYYLVEGKLKRIRE